MSTYHNTFNLDLTILANYQALYGAVRTQLAAFGWVLTADTGQTNPATVGSVPTAGTFPNYEVWKTNDGKTDLYLRLGYGQSAGPMLRVQIGWGTDGAGNLTGNKSDSQDPQISLTSTAQDVYMSGDAGNFMLMIQPTSNGGHNLLVHVTRSQDANGADTSSFASIFGYGWGTGYWQHAVPASGANGVLCNRCSCFNFSPVSGTGWQLGGNDMISPVVAWQPNGNAQPHRDVVVCGGSTDFVANTTTLIPTFGSNRTYLVTSISAGLSVGGSTLCVRYF